VSRDGSTIDGVDLSGVTLEGFALSPGQPINIRLGVHPDAANVGGINLFGRGFGNYPQDVTLRIEYDLVGDDRDAADPAPST
jgi:predicted transcriptional regulator